MSRRLFLAGAAIAIGLLAPLLVGEVVLRFLPVVTGLRTAAVNAAEPVKRFTPRRPFTFSRGWDFKGVNRGRTNNYGFVNDRDYDPAAGTPLLAVVGDSYIEALMVPFPETLQGRLARCVDGRGRVYSFGVSGAALSQYLVEAGFARSRFHPHGLVVVIVGNDFDESLRRPRAAPGYHYFREDSGRLVLERVDYEPSLMRRLLRQSALVRYITMNVPDGGNVLANVRRGLRGPRQEAPRYVGNTAAATDPRRLASSQRAVEEFLARLPKYAGLEPRRIVLVVDGMRPDLYSPAGLRAAGGSYFDLMRRFLMDRAQRLGFEVVDMQPRFVERHARDGSLFEHPFDAHWSGRGHEEAARAVAASGVFQQVFPEASCVR